MLLHGPPRACSLVSDPTGLKAQPWAPCGQAPHPSGPITSISKTTIRSAPSGLRSSGGLFCSCSPVLPSRHPSPRLQLLLFPGVLRAWGCSAHQPAGTLSQAPKDPTETRLVPSEAWIGSRVGSRRGLAVTWLCKGQDRLAQRSGTRGSPLALEFSLSLFPPYHPSGV